MESLDSEKEINFALKFILLFEINFIFSSRKRKIGTTVGQRLKLNFNARIHSFVLMS